MLNRITSLAHSLVAATLSALNISTRRVGGIRFLKIGSINISVSRTRDNAYRPVKGATPRVNHYGFALGTPFHARPEPLDAYLWDDDFMGEPPALALPLDSTHSLTRSFAEPRISGTDSPNTRSKLGHFTRLRLEEEHATRIRIISGLAPMILMPVVAFYGCTWLAEHDSVVDKLASALNWLTW